MTKKQLALHRRICDLLIEHGLDKQLIENNMAVILKETA